MTTLNPFHLAADLLDPPPPPEITDPLWLSPIALAIRCSRGAWFTAPHLQLIETAVLDAIANDGRLIISVSFRHGKSEFIARWLVAWFIMRYRKRVILGTASKDLAEAHGGFARDVVDEYGPDLFDVTISRSTGAKANWDLASPNGTGGLLAIGVGSKVTGRGGDLLVVDDPFGSYEDAMSPLQRKRVQDWFTGTLMSRLNRGRGAVVVICARWHEDDLSGMLLREAPDEWTEIRLPAFAEEGDPLGRQPGDPLWPELYSADALRRMERTMALTLGPSIWRAQAQQTPTNPKGGKFPEDRWVWIPPLTHQERLETRWVRGWDLAATEGAGDYTVGALVGRRPDGRTVIADIVRGQWAPDEVRAQMLRCARKDPDGTRIEIPQDPAQAGKDQAQQLIRLLVGFDAHAKPQTGSKEVRATGLSAQQLARNVEVVEGDHTGAMTAEAAAFPNGVHDDIVDAMATGFNELEGAPGETTASKAKDRRGRR